MSFIQKIIAFLKKLYRVDYLAHLLIILLLGEASFTTVHMFRGNFIAYLIVSLVILLIIFGKDFVYDKWMKKGTFEWMDIILGCSSLVFVIVQWLLLLV